MNEPSNLKNIRMIEVGCEYLGMHKLMFSDIVEQIVTCGKYPTMYGDRTYPEFLVIWDGGEGPHNPESFSEEHIKNEGWEKLSVYPQVIWDMARTVAEGVGLDNQYCIFWFRGPERS